MGRSKEMGRRVEDLTKDELQKELLRCRTLCEIYGNKIAAKELRKRLRKIEKRLTEMGAP